MMTTQHASNEIERRRAARRTAWVMAGIAVAIFVLFFVQVVASR